MDTEQYPLSNELSSLIDEIGGITLTSEKPELLDSQQWVALPEREAGFVCASDAPLNNVKSLREILTAVHDVNAVLEESQQSADEQQEMERLAMLDPLTELPNRRKLFEVLHEIVDSNTLSAILQIDLDRFKEINDSLGHAAGDEVLIVVANRLSSNVRPGDLVTRVGGDEFVVACPNIQDEHAMVDLATRIITSLNQPLKLEGHQYQVGVSIGVSFKRPDQQTEVDTWLQNADLALYTSKEKGRNQFHLYETEMRERFDDAQSMKQELSTACENGSIIAHFQPTFCLQSDRVFGIQAMARWQHSRFGLQSFTEFAQHADENILRAIDKEMFNQCLQGIQRLNQCDADLSKYAIAAPMARLRESESVEYLQQETRCHDLSASKVSLELIDDGKPIAGDEQLLQNLQTLREEGYGICLSNVGGRHCNLQAVLHLQPHSLKLDSSLCCDLKDDHAKQNLVSAMISLAENMNASTIATAVESEEDKQLLAQLGCSLIQGNVVHPPTDIDSLARWLASPDSGMVKAA